MQNKYLEIKECKYGRGLFAKKDIEEGTVVEISPVITLNKTDIKHIHKTKLIHYTFYIDTECNVECVCLGLGSLFNHDKNPNVKMINSKKEEKIIFKTIKQVKKGEELYLDYGYDIEELEKELQKNRNSN